MSREPSSTPPAVLVLTADEAVLEPALEAEWLSRLPVERRTTIAAWSSARDRARSLIGTRLLSIGLHHIGFDAVSLASLRHAPRARPTLDLPVQFSLSHCEGAIGCAISRDLPVGFDIEPATAATGSGFRLYLNAAESAWCGDDPLRFASVWTRKEAVAKAAGGDGLAAVRSIDVSASLTQARFEGACWRTIQIGMGDRFVAHLATRDGECLVHHRVLPTTALCSSDDSQLPRFASPVTVL
jgi:4'-phosphopantetheinyl transferase